MPEKRKRIRLKKILDFNPKTRSRMILGAKILIVVFVAVLLVFLSAKSFANVTLSNLTDGIRGVFLNLKSGEGYPYQVSADGVNAFGAIGKNLSILDDNYILNLSDSAGEMLKAEHNYAKAALSVRNGRALVYDKTSSKFMVTSRSEVLYGAQETNKKLDQTIITASIGKNGNMAFATWTDEGVSKLTVFDHKLKERFSYVFASDRIVTVSLSDNGKYAAAAVLGAENAKIYSDVYIFALDQTEPVNQHRYEGQTVAAVEFIDGNHLEVISTHMKSMLTVGKEHDEADDMFFEEHTLSEYAFDSKSKRSAVLLSEYGNNGTGILYGFSDKGKQQFELKLDSVKKIACNGRYTVALLSDRIVCLNNRGKQKGEITLKMNVDNIALCGNHLYLFSGDSIYTCRPNRTMTLESV